MEDISQLKMECRCLAKNVMTEKKQDEDLEGDLDFFLSAYGVGKNCDSPLKNMGKHLDKGKKLSF